MSNFKIRINDDFSLVVNGVTMSGFVERVSIGGQMIVEEQSLILTSGKEKTFNGFDDASIKIYFKMIEPEDGALTRYNKLLLITDAFKKIRNGAPTVYALEGQVFRAHQLKACLFMALTSDDSIETDSIDVIITLEEHAPVVAKVQRQQGSSSASAVPADNPPAVMTAAEQRKLAQLEGYYHG